jgi:hypothetical protein
MKGLFWEAKDIPLQGRGGFEAPETLACYPDSGQQTGAGKEDLEWLAAGRDAQATLGQPHNALFHAAWPH